LVSGLVNGLVTELVIELVSGLVNGLVTELVIQLVNGLVSGLVTELVIELANVLASEMLSGLVFGLGVVWIVCWLSYLLPQIVVKFAGVQNLKRKYNAEWAIVTGRLRWFCRC